MKPITDPNPHLPCPDPFNLAEYVLSAGQTQPNKVALTIMGTTRSQHWRYGQLISAVRGIATGFKAQGLMPGDRILMRIGNSVEFPLCFLGAIAAGLVPVPTSSQLTGPEITAMCNGLNPKLIIAAPGIALPDHPAPVLDLDQIQGFHDLAAAEWHLGDPNRPGYIVFTSGTSGHPRAVVHAHRAIWARRMMWDGWAGLRSDDKVLHAGAFNWTYTLGTGLLDPWSVGATALVPVSGLKPAMLPTLLKRYEATIFAAAPGVYRQILKSGMPPLPHLRHGLSAGEKLAEPLRERWCTTTGTALHEAYGMSECSTFISGSPTRPAPGATLGYAQPGRRIALINADGPVPANTPGTIAVHASDPGLMLGYLGHPDETSARFQGDWFLTGDMGEMSPDGAITYLGRDDDMMNAGGYRVSPIEVEHALNTHPEISECAACELRVKSDASVIGAFYTAPTPLEEPELKDYISQRLAHYKCPRLFIHVASLPRGANNKLLRRALRQHWEATHGQA